MIYIIREIIYICPGDDIQDHSKFKSYPACETDHEKNKLADPGGHGV